MVVHPYDVPHRPDLHRPDPRRPSPDRPSSDRLSSSDRHSPHRHSPLIVTSDPLLMEELLRLTAEIGLIADVAPDPAAARRWFPGAAVVLVGLEMADACARAAFPRRPGVILVARAGDPAAASPDWHLADRLGADHVAMLPAAEPWLLEQLARIESGVVAEVVAVLGGRGGAGASVLASALAVTGSRQGLATLLIDSDPLGGGIDLVLGWEHREGLRWPAFANAGGRVNPQMFVEALPGQPDLVLLSWDRGEPATVTAHAMGAALDAGRHGRDLVIIDLPRNLDDASTLALCLADRAYLVVPAELRACASATRVAAMVLPHSPGLQVVVREPGPSGLSPREVADAIGLPLAGSFRLESSVSTAVERGNPPTGSGRGSLARLCDRLLADCLTRTQRAAA